MKTIISADRVSRVGSIQIRVPDISEVAGSISSILGSNAANWGIMVTLISTDYNTTDSMYIIKHHSSWGANDVIATHIGGANNATFRKEGDILYTNCSNIAGYVAINYTALWTE